MSITEYRTRTASRANRRNQDRAERRVDEIGAVTDISRDYLAADRASDLRMEQHFQAMYALADDEEERAAITAAFVEWGRGEQIEGMAVEDAVAVAVQLLKSNNPFFLDGCGPDGRAA